MDILDRLYIYFYKKKRQKYQIGGNNLHYPKDSYKKSWKYRLLELNKYVLNGFNPNHTPAGLVQDKIYPSWELIESTCKKDIIKNAVINAIKVRIDQRFYDGNHRTSILAIYEYLVDNKLCLKIDPVYLYILISNRQNESWITIQEKMIKAIMKYTYFCEINIDFREQSGELVKQLPDWNKFFEDLFSITTDNSIPVLDKRLKYREIKRKSPKRFIQYRKLYPFSQIH